MTVLQKAGGLFENFVMSNPSVLLCLLAFCSWGLVQFNTDGIYWDDWVLVTQPPAQVAKLMLSLRAPLTALMHFIFLSLGNGVVVYRVFSFVATAFVGCATYRILLYTKLFNRLDALIISALSVVFPVFQSRVALINVPTQMYLMLFMWAWLLALSNYEKKNRWKRISSIILFFCALQFPSLLFFFAIPMLHLMWLGIDGDVLSPRQLVSKTFKWSIINIDFLLVPFVVFISLRLITSLPPSYTGYNALDVRGLLTGIWLSVKAINSSFFQPIFAAQSSPFISLTFFTIIIGLVAAFKSADRNESNASRLNPMRVIGLGIVIFFFSVYPYCAVGKLPEAENWGSRLQLLVAPGAAMILYGIIQCLSRGNRTFAIAATIYSLATFVALDLKYVYAYDVDWMKQTAIIKGLASLDTVRQSTGHAFVFIDSTTHLNAEGRTYRNYELNGFLRKAYSDQSRLGIYPDQCSILSAFSNSKGSMNNVDAYYGDNVAGIIIVELIEDPGSLSMFIFRAFARIINGNEPALFRNKPSIVSVRFETKDGVELPSDCKK